MKLAAWLLVLGTLVVTRVSAAAPPALPPIPPGASRVVLTMQKALDMQALALPAMGQRCAGILCDVDTRKHPVAPKVFGPPKVSNESPPEMREDAGDPAASMPAAEPLYMHVQASGGAWTVFTVAARGEAWDITTITEPIKRWSISRSDFEHIFAAADAFRGSMDDAAIAPGTEADLPQPYEASAVTMDQPTMKRRLYRGMNVVNPAANRDLAKQTFRVRVPGGYTPRTPAGLLVWCSPHGSAQTPRGFESALDELNILCICVDSGGNDRPTPDRLQLMFDAVTNATRRFHIDPRRVYISGLSGGGKISTIAMFCYPEIFRGAIPIVGLATHSTLGESWGEHSSGYFAKPAGDLAAQARARRVAPVTGEHDMNYAEIKERVRLLEADGFDQVRLFDVPGMGHTMPPADVCAEALRFIDEPGRAAMKAEGDAAQQKLDAYLGERKDATPRSEDDRRALAAVMQAGPWSEAAWKALDLLRSAATTRPANGPT